MHVPKSLWLVPILLLAGEPATASGPPMVFFESGSARLDAQDEAILDWAVRWLQSVGAERIHIDASADRVGSAAANLRLSRRRAEAVRASLVRRGFPGDRIQIRAHGEPQLLIDTSDGVPEPQNRYATVLIAQMSPPAR